jgi:hypothetical protein
MYEVMRSSYVYRERVGTYRFKIIADTVACLITLMGGGHEVGYVNKV